MHEIKAGEDLKAKPVQDNFDELVSKISSLSTRVDGISSSTSSQVKTVQDNLQSNINSVQSTLQGNINAVNTNLTNAVNGKLSGAISKAANGYATFSNGLIIQWGRSPAVSQGSDPTVSLPRAFSNSNSYKVIPVNQNANDSNRTLYKVNSQATSSFVVRAQQVEGGGGGTTTVQFIAIGY